MLSLSQGTRSALLTNEVVVKIPKSSDYVKNVKACRGSSYPCVVCGRPIRKPVYFVECVEGSTDECCIPGKVDNSDPAYMGLHPLGAACLLNHPELEDYVIRV